MVWKVEENLKIGRLLTFIPNKRLPIYNWIYFKEGFSRDLVLLLLKEFGAKEGEIVLDPFCGVGTTLLACKENGINSIGFDVLPLAVFASRVKLRDYEISELKKVANWLFSQKFVRPSLKSVPGWIRRFFLRATLEDVLYFKSLIEQIEDQKIREFFLLGLMNAAMKCSFVYKDGAVLKVKRHPVAPLKYMFRRIAKRMIRDLEKIEFKPCSYFVDYGDARKLKLADESVNYIITSPPYLNKIEYTRVYEIEQTLFIRDRPRPPLRTFFGLGKREITPPIDVPEETTHYFIDLHTAISELNRVLVDGGRLAIVIGDGFVRGRVIEVLKLTAKLVEQVGMSVEKVIIANKRIATTPQRKKVGILEEGIVLAEK